VPSLRILTLIGGSYVSGAEIVALETMKGLRNRGHEVQCVANGWNDGDFVGRLDQAGISHDTVKLGFISKQVTDLKYLRWTLNALLHLPKAWYRFRRIDHQFDPDVVVVHGTRMAAMIRPLLRPDETVFYIHGTPSPTFFTRRIIDEGGTHGALYVGVSEYIRSRICEMGVPEERAAVVYNGVHIPESHGVDRTQKGERPTTVGIVGQIGDWKGHDDFIEALRLLNEAGLKVRGIIVGRGDDDYENALREHIGRSGLSDLVEWRGYVRDTDKIYEGIDICVVPSRFSEPFGLVAAEAGARGIPVVATRRGGLPEIVENEKTGYLVEAEAPTSLADRIAALVQNPERRRKIGRAARRRIRETFSKEEMVDQLEAHLVQCAGSEPA
jgi:glycosyltransferase involved in cell wall biosynthesis